MEDRNMYQEYDDDYVSDLDEDIKRRESLLEEVRAMQELDDVRVVNDLQRRWKRIPYWENAYEDTLIEEFDSYMDAFYQKRKSNYQENALLKQDLIIRAKEALKEEQDKLVHGKINDLFSQWKQCGSAGKEEDDRLWEEFNAVRQAFFDRKKKNWDDMQERFQQASVRKENIIEKAKEALKLEDMHMMNDTFKQLMEEWKAVGSAGREVEDRLWNAFQESRQQFFEKRDAFYDAMHEEQQTCYEQKQELIARAKEVVESQTFLREHTLEMKDLQVKWKAIGHCGKEKEHEIYREFRKHADAYFDGLKQFNEEKHMQWRKRMMDVKAKKLELIANQKRQIKYLENELVGLLGERAIEETKEEIEEKKDFIHQLENEVEEMNKTLQE